MSVRPRSSHSCEPVPCWRACIKPVALTVVSVAARLDVGQSFIPGQLLMLDITTLSRASRSGTWFLLRRQRPFENSRQQKGVVVSLGTLKARRGDDSLDVVRLRTEGVLLDIHVMRRIVLELKALSTERSSRFYCLQHHHTVSVNVQKPDPTKAWANTSI